MIFDLIGEEANLQQVHAQYEQKKALKLIELVKLKKRRVRKEVPYGLACCFVVRHACRRFFFRGLVTEEVELARESRITT